MTVSEAITKSGLTPSASYTGIETANDFVLAFQIDSTQTKESQWIVCADHVKEHSGSLNATTEDAQYIRTGNVTEKTGTQRTLATRSCTAPAAISLCPTSTSACAPARARKAALPSSSPATWAVQPVPRPPLPAT